jgi:hypothetical protein
MLPRILNNHLTKGGKIVSLTRRPSFTLKENPDTDIASERIRSIDKSNDIVGTRDTPAFGIVRTWLL